ncbi:MAG: HNH endonuclease signature motif containing protein, partial [Dermatophilaceae bacterium]
MSQHRMSLSERRSAVKVGRGALAGLGALLHEASGADLADLMVLADEAAALARAVQVEIAVEAVRRGEIAGREVDSWVKGHAPSLRQGGWYPLATIAREVAAASRGSGLGASASSAALDGSSPLGIVWAAMTPAVADEAPHDESGDVHGGGDVHGVVQSRVAGEMLLSPGSALAVLAEIGKLAPRLLPPAVPTVTEAMVDLVGRCGTSTMRRLRPALIAKHGITGELDRLQERLVPSAYLSSPRVRSAEVTEYALAMTPSQAAVLEAAIGPRSAPQPNDETGEADLRPAGQRRVEALTEVLSRGAAVDIDATAGGDGAAGSPVAVHVTIPLADLRDMTAGDTAEKGAGEVLGSVATGALIGPGQLRRIACDAVLVPYVLGSRGEIVDQGRAVRLFTKAQRRRLTLRDRGCTYPGCGAPAAWCKAHHVRWWEHHGPSDIDNAALLCGRHHTVVHTRRLWATVDEVPDEHGRSVTWDLTPGSYDQALGRCRARERGLDHRRAHAARLHSGLIDHPVADIHHDDDGAAEHAWPAGCERGERPGDDGDGAAADGWHAALLD